MKFDERADLRCAWSRDKRAWHIMCSFLSMLVPLPAIAMAKHSRFHFMMKNFMMTSISMMKSKACEKD